MSNTTRSEMFGHPTGLFVLFFTEMWERFSYYGMRAILVLYITTSTIGDNPGLGWDTADALALYGWYTMLVYVMSIPGGIIADKWLGQKKSVLIGGLILVAGHGILAIEQMWAFYMGLGLIILGVGGLKPNISTMVGGLYPKGDIRRDKGFTIFYIGINIGAALSSIAVGYVGEKIGWHYGFGMAGIGMLIGQLVYMLGQKHLTGVGEAPVLGTGNDDGNSSLGELMTRLVKTPSALITTIVLALGSVAILFLLSIGYGLLGLFLSLVVGMMIAIYTELDRIEKDRYLVLLISFIIVIVFWGAFEQAGGLMNIYTEAKVNRMVLGTEIPASVFQSVNAIFIILFGTLVANFWARRKAKKKESSSLFKMAIGTIIMGVGFLAMVKASMEVLSTGEAALIWVILAYFLHTIGELSASPVALSFITKLAPAKYVSILMGVYFAATGLGNKVAGAIGELSQSEPIGVTIAETYSPSSGVLPADSLSAGGVIPFKGLAYVSGSDVVVTNEDGADVSSTFAFEGKAIEELTHQLTSEEATKEAPTVININLEPNVEKGQSLSMASYSGQIEVFESVNKRELKTFMVIFLFTLFFGLVLILGLKKLKKLTHGIEEAEK